jgi:iron complex outermembrane receptor protein
MFNKTKFFWLTLLLLPLSIFGQNCDIKLTGFVQDLSTGKAISYANIYIKEIQKGAVTDSNGFFQFESICKGKFHISVSHIGCEIQNLYFNVSKDTSMTVLLDHNSQSVNEVVVKGKVTKTATQEILLINAETISQNSDKGLANMLENISGVSVIKNGSGIAKPVVHGLYGNRLTILNNGIAQSGQQWGVDHSPEIDPLVANRITVVKGVGALEYQGSSLGSVILVEPKKIKNDPHLHGEVRYSFESNGLGNGVNLDLQQYSKFLAWRIVGTLKKSGDRRTVNYYLNNTGSQEANIALQLEKKWNERWSSDLYFSSFNAELGVLRGAHIGNLTDLEEALERDVPFYTENDFSYEIASPYQQVNHQLLKLHTLYNINEHQKLDVTYAGQYNLRKEFDVRRSGRSEMPALSLSQFSHFIETKYQNYLAKNWDFKTGLQVKFVDNTNLPETGILPLIPDYFSTETGLFALLTKRFQKTTTLSFGARYDFENRKVLTISASIPREIIRYENNFHNINAMAGVTQVLFKNWKIAYNLGFASRNPAINELYSNGLHQGVSGIEEGDPNLKTELSLKNTLSINGNVKGKWFMEGLVYFQQVNNYIYLNPQDEIRLTIRGAFPVFKYEQTNARLIGFDLASTYQFTERFNIMAKYSFLKGQDQSNDLPLIYMPSNNLSAEANYQIPKLGKFQKNAFSVNGKYVFKQNNLLASQDFVAAPDAYFLLDLKFSTEIQLKKLRLKLHLRGENVLNTSYRDYLNRQRYFADDQGFNIIFGINLGF